MNITMIDFIACFIIIFVLTHKNLEKKLDLTILVVAAITIYVVDIQWGWVAIFSLSCLYFGIKYKKQPKKN
ncbi:hypothetical protein NF868_01445 [Bacillus zhangzhouensis]|nr:hypothetical protein NF868_01445 [Bacillus zhangzhouensis]